MCLAVDPTELPADAEDVPVADRQVEDLVEGEHAAHVGDAGHVPAAGELAETRSKETDKEVDFKARSTTAAKTGRDIEFPAAARFW